MPISSPWKLFQFNMKISPSMANFSSSTKSDFNIWLSALLILFYTFYIKLIIVLIKKLCNRFKNIFTKVKKVALRIGVFIVLDLALALAIILNEMHQRKIAKVYQTIFMTPYFLSWVVVSFVAYSLAKRR